MDAPAEGGCGRPYFSGHEGRSKEAAIESPAESELSAGDLSSPGKQGGGLSATAAPAREQGSKTHAANW
ncbi:MAG: hypothetical protein ABL874_05175, partial [Sphingopyxis sp.]